MSDTAVDGILRRLYDEIKVEVEKEVYGLTAGRGRDMKEKVDGLEAEARHLKAAVRTLKAMIRTKAKIVEELPSIENPEVERLRIENEDLRDTIASDDATRRDKKIKVVRLEGEVESLHSVIKLKDERLTWWRQHADDQNRTIEKLQERVDALTSSPPETGYKTWEQRLWDSENT